MKLAQKCTLGYSILQRYAWRTRLPSISATCQGATLDPNISYHVSLHTALLIQWTLQAHIMTLYEDLGIRSVQ